MLAAASACLASAVLAADRPNIIFLVTDDQRADAMGCAGNPVIHTPNMDKLAAEGTLFTNNFVTTSICCVSRASFFTGMYGRTHKVEDFRTPIPESVFAITYPMLLKNAGYRTAFIGKWGVGGPLPKKDFDFWDGFPGQGKYFHEKDGKTVHLTGMIGEKAVKFLRSCSPDQPFCLSVSFKAPHVLDGAPKPFQPDPAFDHLYQSVTVPVPETAHDRFFRALPAFIQKSEGRRRWKNRFATPKLFQSRVKDYYRLISGVDHALGRILQALQQSKLDDNTVIIFTGDNGFFLGERGLAGKWLMYEESIRTPLIIRDPRLPASLRRQRIDKMVLNIDVAPTIIDLAGQPVPSPMQGRSLRPLMQQKPVKWRTEFFYEHLYRHGGKIPAIEGVRTDRWKYTRYIDTDPLYEELFDLANDPLEKRNLATEPAHRDTLEKLRARWKHWTEKLSG
jgi:arylsulfatase A-like enzyme